MHAKPIGFLNVAGYYDSLFAFLDQSVAAGFVRPKHRQLAVAHDDATALLDMIAAVDVSYESKLSNRPQR